MASYLNAPHPNTRFGVRICALALASVTERTCVLSIVPVITIIRITQGIRSGDANWYFCKMREIYWRGEVFERSLQPADDRAFERIAGIWSGVKREMCDRPLLDFSPDIRLTNAAMSCGGWKVRQIHQRQNLTLELASWQNPNAA